MKGGPHYRVAVWAILLLLLAVMIGCREGIWLSAPAEPTQEQVEKTFPVRAPSTEFTATVPSPDGGTPSPTSTPTSPETPPAGDAERGEGVFQASCNICHPGGGAGVGPTLAGVSDRVGDQELVSIIRQGRGVMPAFTPSSVSDEQMADLVAFLKTLR